jgi:hypothetical protein
MGQILKKDKIGALSHNAGIITLPASTLTIGGQQYVTSSLTRTIATDVTMAANTRYQIYAVVSGGVVVLRVSSNENSVGPSGFTAWKLAGSFMANGMSPVAFGSFLNVSGIPKSDEIQYIPTFQGFGTPTNVKALYIISGKDIRVDSEFTTGTNTAVQARHSLPSSFTISSNLGNTGPVVISSFGLANNSPTARYILATASNSFFNFGRQDSTYSANIARNGDEYQSATRSGFTAVVSINELSNTPIEDL